MDTLTMSTWHDVDLTGINPGDESIAVGDYTFTVSGGKYDGNDPNKVVLIVTIANECDFTGRKLFPSYPDPSKYDWSPKAFKRLEQAIGVDVQPGQDPVEYLNSVAGHKFAAPVKLGKVSENYPTPRSEMDIFKVRPAA